MMLVRLGPGVGRPLTLKVTLSFHEQRIRCNWERGQWGVHPNGDSGRSQHSQGAFVVAGVENGERMNTDVGQTVFRFSEGTSPCVGDFQLAVWKQTPDLFHQRVDLS